MQSLIDALRAKSHPQAGIPLPRPDPRDWAQRAVPQGSSEEGLGGAIYPDDLMRSMGVAPPAGRPVDQFNYEGHPQGVSPSQFPMGIPQPMESRGAGLFGVPAQHLQQMAGDVVPMPKGDYDLNREKAKLFEGMEPGSILDKLYPKAPVIPFPPQHMSAAKPVDQNLPKLPQSGFVPSLSPMYMNDKGLGAPPAPNQPPIFWQPG